MVWVSVRRFLAAQHVSTALVLRRDITAVVSFIATNTIYTLVVWGGIHIVIRVLIRRQ